MYILDFVISKFFHIFVIKLNMKMIKWIVKANSWYDTMKEPNRTLFFFFVILPLICGTQPILTTIYGDIGFIYWGIWIMIMWLFRMMPVFVDIKNKNV